MQLIPSAGRLLLASSSLLLPYLTAPTHAEPLDDIKAILASTDKTGDVLYASLDPFKSELNTSDIIMALVYQIGASQANLENTSNTTSLAPQNATLTPYYPFTNTTTTPPTTNLTSPTTTNSTTLSLTDFDPTYFTYTNSLLTLSEAVLLRGKNAHSEASFPVFSALQALGLAVHGYGLRARETELVGLRSVVRTRTAGSAISGAGGVWDDWVVGL